MATVLKVKNTFIDIEFDADELENLNDDSPSFSRLATAPAPYTNKLLEVSAPTYAVSTVDTLPFAASSREGDSASDSDRGRVTSHEILPEFGVMNQQSSSEAEPVQSEPMPASQAMGYDLDLASMTMNQGGMWAMQSPMMQFPMMQFPMNSMMQQPMQFPTAVCTNAAPSLPLEWRTVHTVMMRNLPNKVTQQQLLSEMNESGFENTYDFLYLPIDADTNANRGYAFINFTTPEMAMTFKMHFEGQKLSNFHSRKILSVMPATLQGFEANYAHYSSAHVKFRDAGCRPLFLREPKSTKLQRRGGQKSLIDEAAKQMRRHGQVPPQMQQQRQIEIAPVAAAAPLPEPEEDSSKQRAAKFCINCGGGVQMHYKFCRFCGVAAEAA